MATDLSSTDRQAQTIIDGALRKLSVLVAGQSASGSTLTDALEELNRIKKELDGSTFLSAKRATDPKTAAMVSTDRSVALNAAVMDVQGAVFVETVSGEYHPLKVMSRDQFIATYDGTSGDPSYYYVTNNGGTKKLWLNKALTVDGTLYYWSRDKFDIFDTSTDTSDAPDELINYLVWQLAANLAPEYGKSFMYTFLSGKAQEAWTKGSGDSIDVPKRGVLPDEQNPEVR